MKKDKQAISQRREFLTHAGLVTAGVTVAASAVAQGQSGNGNTEFVPMRHSQDSWMNELGSGHRVFVDSQTGPGGLAAMNFANNILLAHAQGYGGSDSDYGMIVCFRHDSSPFGFNDAMWEKYNELFMRRTGVSNEDGSSVTVNPLNVERSPYGNRSNTIETLQNRGVHYAICNLSTRGMAGMLARSTGASADDVYQELVDNKVPNGHIVPAGVMAATRAQEYGYSLLYSAQL